MGADDFRINGVPLNKALFGFGDAVCVPVIEWISENVLLPALDELRKYKKPESSSEPSVNIVNA